MTTLLFQDNSVRLHIPVEFVEAFPYKDTDTVYIQCHVIRMPIEHDLVQEWGIDDFPGTNPREVVWFQPFPTTPPDHFAEHSLTQEGEFCWFALYKNISDTTPVYSLCKIDEGSELYAIITEAEQDDFLYSSSDQPQVIAWIPVAITNIALEEIDEGEGLYARLIPEGQSIHRWTYCDIMIIRN